MRLCLNFLIVLLLGNSVISNYIILTKQPGNNSTSNPKICTDTKQCPFSDACITCDKGREPNCEQPTCINGQCGVIARCSQEVLSTTATTTTTTTTTSSNQCTGTDSSRCIVNHLCALCLEGYSPGCTQVECVNSQCKIIPPCSIYTSTTTSLLPGSSTATVQCENDNQCAYVKQCVQACADGSSPLCAFGQCANGQCVITAPCSQKPACTDQNLSRCPIPRICADCKLGSTPPCAQAACENGKCKVIMPCTVLVELTTTLLPTETCTRDEECPRMKICAAKCSNGTTPLCASAKCVDSQCVNIKPCSQLLCTTRATCPYNKRNCLFCVKDLGPPCEQPLCSYGICSIVPPCSKKLTVLVDAVTINTILTKSK